MLIQFLYKHFIISQFLYTKLFFPKFDNFDLKLKTQATSLPLKQPSSEISHFSRVPAFIVNMLLVTLSKQFIGHKYTVIEIQLKKKQNKNDNYFCKLVNSYQELYKFLPCSRVKSKSPVRCLRQDFGFYPNILIDVMEYLGAGGSVVNSPNVAKRSTALAINFLHGKH